MTATDLEAQLRALEAKYNALLGRVAAAERLAAQAVQNQWQAWSPGSSVSTPATDMDYGYLDGGHTVGPINGLTLGGGTVYLCTKSGASLTITSEQVTLYSGNDQVTGPAITPMIARGDGTYDLVPGACYLGGGTKGTAPAAGLAPNGAVD